MAGQGFKDFAVGEVLTAADVDGYLMQQSVMRFADSAARGSALGTATGTAVPLAEGMVSYLADTDAVEVYNGSAWTSIGLPPVQQAYVTTNQSVTSTAYTDLTGATITVTPQSATSKFLLLFTNFGEHSIEQSVSMRFDRGGSTIGEEWLFTGGAGYRSSTASSYLDSPATTSAVTYKLEVKVNVGTFTSSTSSLTVFEVSA